MSERKRAVLIIAAHPDDELLGCGGTIALHAERGDRVTSVVVCAGESLRYEGGEVDQQRQMQEAAEILGISESICLAFPDQKLDTYSLVDVIIPLEEVMTRVRPSFVYCQYGGDINLDHQILFQAALVATRPVDRDLEAVYAYETASSTEWAFPRTFVPDTWVDITSTLERKIRAMACYSSEVRDYPHPRSLEALRNRARAWGNQVAADASEVFMTVRRVLRDGETPA